MKQLLKKLLPQPVLRGLRNIRNRIAPPAALREERQRRKALAVFFSHWLTPNELCFDIGANNGMLAEAMLQNGVRVVAVEPQEACCRQLRKQFGAGITIVQKGIDEQPGRKQLFISESSTISTFSSDWLDKVKDGRFHNQTWNKTIEVEMTTLDELIKEFGEPGFIKIDVEGYELPVLKGLSVPVKKLSFEYAVPEQTQSLDECVAWLQQLSEDYRFNFCVNEETEFCLAEWLTADQMRRQIADATSPFNRSGWGDIYAKRA